MRGGPLLALALLLTALLLAGCQSAQQRDAQQREQQTKLEARVSALEGQVETLQKEVATLRARSLTVNAPNLTQAAAADACALDVARDQESYLEANAHYATSDGQLPPPGSCSDLTLKWLKREGHAYQFQILDAQGQVLSQRSNE